MDKFVQRTFHLFETLVGEAPCKEWKAIVDRVTKCARWKDENGNRKTNPRGHTWESLELCQRKFLLQVFKKDAAETQRLYMSHGLRKPGRMTIRQFIQRLQKLSRDIRYLPTLFDSDMAAPGTERMNRPFTEFELCDIVLRCCKQEWVDQYYLVNQQIPTSVADQVESTHQRKASAKAQPKNKPKATSRGGANGCDDKRSRDHKGKRGGGSRRSEKFCHRCKTHGGPYTTHNTSDCQKYDADADGNIKPDFGRRGGACNNNAQVKNAFALLKKDIDSLTKTMEKVKKSSKKSKKRRIRYESDSSDSD